MKLESEIVSIQRFEYVEENAVLVVRVFDITNLIAFIAAAHERFYIEIDVSISKRLVTLTHYAASIESLIEDVLEIAENIERATGE